MGGWGSGDWVLGILTSPSNYYDLVPVTQTHCRNDIVMASVALYPKPVLIGCCGV